MTDNARTATRCATLAMLVAGLICPTLSNGLLADENPGQTERIKQLEQELKSVKGRVKDFENPPGHGSPLRAK